MQKHIIQIILQDAYYTCFPFRDGCLAVKGRLQDVAAELIEGAHGLLDGSLPYEMSIRFRTAEQGGEKDAPITYFHHVSFVRDDEETEVSKEDLEEMIMQALQGGPLHMANLVGKLSTPTLHSTDINTTVLTMIITGGIVLTEDRKLSLPKLKQDYVINGRPKITHVAIKYKGQLYALPEPNRHYHVIDDIHICTGDWDIYPEEEGFLDASGRFLNRRQALVSAQLNGQVKDPSKVKLNMLTSEDLW